ncbi:hypothetical protein MRB53_031992 [Persea americana]|uniref:Uncharacterized protein n=1 Tax=Persea americana TaxID=3435 RepID=A0ACC2KQW3_PERAE|nr:hypothetical protein MRB53_031992 [Persea americana]|eukprot:TRINITY_DN15890_c1_g1_i1.p1 TRINITY_DN15890_c1_g1~~TRINITY_DN15890_c1_g1_i1.p1  ORF type:complete len:376 (+),score=39.58 TRINITY_DN15890_c1_g1_i1:143-1270(+)
MARKECYLYVQTIPMLLRLNLSDLCESGSSAEFEIAHNYSTSDDRVPIGMACLVVGSKIYMVGGEKSRDGRMVLFYPEEENWFNTTDVYVFDHTKSESEDRLVPVRDGDGAALGRLNGPKSRPIVVTLEGKFYVLSTRPFLGSLSEDTTPVFEVFDPTLPTPSWKVLPRQPNFPVLDYFAWGHKLLTMLAPTRPGFFIFDTEEEKWAEDWDFIEQFTDKYRPTSTPVPNGPAVEFKGVVFAVSMDINALVAYDLDASGMKLNAHWVLDELSEVFEGPPSLFLGRGFLTDLGGGRMCVLFSGDDKDNNLIVRVEVFRVDITTVGDRPVVHREILRSFKLPSWNGYSPVIDSVFMCDHSNQSNIEADANSGLYSCED